MTVAAIDEDAGPIRPLVFDGRSMSVGLVEFDDVVSRRSAGLSHFSRISSRQFQQVMKIAVLNFSAQIIGPDFINLMPTAAQGRIHLPDSAGRARVRIRLNVGSNKYAKRF